MGHLSKFSLPFLEWLRGLLLLFVFFLSPSDDVGHLFSKVRKHRPPKVTKVPAALSLPQTGQKPITLPLANGNHPCPLCKPFFLRHFPFSKFQDTGGGGVGGVERRRKGRKEKKKRRALSQNPGGIRNEALRPLSLLMKTVATGPLQQEHTCELCTFNLSPQLQATGHKPVTTFLVLQMRKLKPGEVKYHLSKSHLWALALCPFTSQKRENSSKHLQPDQSTSAGTFSAGTKSPLHNSVASKTSSATQYSDSKTGQRLYEHTDPRFCPKRLGET